MKATNWTVKLYGQAKKAFTELPERTAKTFRLLIEDLELNGYQRNNWPNFGKLKDTIYHCHLEKGRPTYVACWRIYKKEKLMRGILCGNTRESTILKSKISLMI